MPDENLGNIYATMQNSKRYLNIESDNINVIGNLDVSNNVDISGNLTVSNNVDISGNLTVTGTITSLDPYYLRMGYDTIDWVYDNTPVDQEWYPLPWIREQNGWRGTSTSGVPAGDTPGNGIWKPSITGYYMVTARVNVEGNTNQIKQFYFSLQRNYLTYNSESESETVWGDLCRDGAAHFNQAYSYGECGKITTVVQVTDTKYSYRFAIQVDLNSGSGSTTSFPRIIKDFVATGVEIYKLV